MQREEIQVTQLTGIKALGEALKENQTLTHLKLSDNNLQNAGVILIAEALKTNRILTSIDLSSNNIQLEGAKWLAGALKINTALTYLNLYSNKLGDTGVAALAAGLKVNQTLIEIDLMNTHMGDIGVKDLAKALNINRSLEKLWLSYNNITNEGAKTLAQALRTNQGLRQLELNGNKIGDEGAKALAEVLYENKTLDEIGLSNNNITDAGAKALAQALQGNNTLRKINLSGNNLSQEVIAAIMQALQNNNTLTEIIFSQDNIVAIPDNYAAMLAKILMQNNFALLRPGVRVNNDYLRQIIYLALERNNLIAQLFPGFIDHTHTLLNLSLGNLNLQEQDLIRALVNANNQAAQPREIYFRLIRNYTLGGNDGIDRFTFWNDDERRLINRIGELQNDIIALLINHSYYRIAGNHQVPQATQILPTLVLGNPNNLPAPPNNIVWGNNIALPVPIRPTPIRLQPLAPITQRVAANPLPPQNTIMLPPSALTQQIVTNTTLEQAGDFFQQPQPYDEPRVEFTLPPLPLLEPPRPIEPRIELNPPLPEAYYRFAPNSIMQ